jgi:2-polyprenyl-6-methoxyphenol hydroxylase-like FAD-dependent oxidoreductase
MTDRETIATTCCIAGGGPAGMMLGFLLARAGVDVLVMEKHKDFLRDFRGDTIHPSTLEVMHELGLLPALLDLPHQKLRTIEAVFGEKALTIADFGHLPTQCGYIAFMPQWDFLDFLAGQAAAYPAFSLRMECEVTDLVERDGRIAGVRATGADGDIEVRADLTIAADGRGSILRDRSGLAVRDFGAPMDVMWFRLEKSPGTPDQPLGRFGAGFILIAIDRGDYWQCGYVIPKGAQERIRAEGFDAFRARIGRYAPALTDALRKLPGWDDVKLLTVQVNRLDDWCKPGFLCIGDAAHAMSPVAGVGINLAVQDAVAAANALAGPLRDGSAGLETLRAVERRRKGPVEKTQRLQLMIQNRVISGVLDDTRTPTPPLPMRLANAIPILRRIPGRLIGLGVQPEHVETPDAGPDAGKG